MHTIIHPSQWKVRASALGLSIGELAKAAGISHTLLYRKLKDGEISNFTQSTMEAVSGVILKREIETLAHLENLHPQSEHGHGEAE
jgi:predicted transcriptional regulator